MIVAIVGHVPGARMLLVMSVLTSVAHRYLPHSSDGLAVRCYWTASSDVLSNINGLSLLDCAVAMT
jgi:hypothetical protein